MFAAPIYAADWTVVAEDKAADEERQSFIYSNFAPIRSELLRNSIRGLMDFGWQPFEVVKTVKDDLVLIQTIKPLLQDLTVILVNDKGQPVGLRNSPIGLSIGADIGPVEIFFGEALLISHDTEGTQWYGEPLMRRVERAYDSWNDSDDAARRYDKKMAGSHWVVYYPVGSSMYNDVETDNFTVAQGILATLESSGRIAVPVQVSQQIGELNSYDPSKNGWRVELIDGSSAQGSFVERLRYLDTLKARGLGLTERSVFEGQFGTKAEAEAHADFTIDNIERFHDNILSAINDQAVNALLELNWGPEARGSVRLKKASLSDSKRAFLRELYLKHFEDRDNGGAAIEEDKIDWDALREEFGIPIRSTKVESAPVTQEEPKDAQ
jgi:hypothetical protein